MRPVCLLPLSLCLVAASATAARDTLRCGNQIVSEGLSIEQVLADCGEPDQRDREQRPVRSGNRVLGTYLAETWRYDRGNGQFPAVLEFHDGVLKSIRFLDHR